MSDIENTKPPRRDYIAPIGQGYRDPSRVNLGAVPTTYADINALKRGLVKLITEIDAFGATLEQQLSTFALSVTPLDPKLQSSVEAEWPSQLGPVKDHVSYAFYKALRFRLTTAASYIRMRFEEGARDITGTAALDFYHLISITRDEAAQIQGFLNAYIGNVNDVAEYRTIEQFQDWLISAVGFTRQFEAFFKKGNTNPQFVLPDAIRGTTAQEAQRGQALFKIKLNSENDAIERDLQFLKRYFSDSASTFYSQYLGPALKYRLNISSRSMPVGNRVDKAVADSSLQTDASLSHALTDQMRRRLLFEDKVGNILGAVEQRDKYRSYINQLSVRGRSLPSSGAGIMLEGAELSADEAQYFYETELSNPSARQTSLVPPHSVLSSLETNDHPQYLLRAGGVITGPITMGPSGRIDGILPSTHRHTGSDGSTKIHGADILEGTLDPSTIDPTAKPPQPYSLSIGDIIEAPSLSGGSTVDAIIEWKGLDEYSYEIQVTRL